MKNYRYERIEAANNPVKDAIFGDHRKVIDEYAEKGYRYVGCIPVRIGPSGKILEMDLIFESEI